MKCIFLDFDGVINNWYQFDGVSTEKKLIERSKELSNRLGINISVNELKTSLKFYTYINKGMIKSYNIKWNKYLELMNINDLDEINKKISCNENNIV